MLDIELLERLCKCDGISGDEGEVRKLIIEEIKPYADRITVDNLGNLIVHKKGKNRAKSKLMLSAHMDEVGLMVTDITSDGYLKFDEVGGIDRRVLLGKNVTVGKNKINGVIGVKPIHLCKGEETGRIPELSDMYIDIGADSKADALKYIKFGDSINFVSDFTVTSDSITSKALDDRFGCLVLIELIKNEPEYDMDFAFVVQEEVGLRGAKVAAFTVDPEFALVIETTTAADVPEIDANKQVCNLSDGAVISVMDRRTIYDKEMIALAFDCAEKSYLKVQYKRAVAGGNDAGVIHSSRSGVRTLAVSLPCRYLHSSNCVVNKQDCENMIELVSTLAENIAGGKLSSKGTER
ncbi:M42 family metallopeptidase [Ruminococcus sp.]|uniref:M42 family metallopeptidase n=1 Tax=Ruminococcus sp. TaxID=41978 RepID=UPI003F04F254